MPTPDDLFNAPIFTDGTPPNQDTVSFRRALDQIRQSPHDILDWLQNTTGGDLRLIVSLLQGQAQQIGGLTAALDKLAGSVATAQGNPGLADELRAVIHDEMTKVVQVQVSVANPTPASAAPASTAAP